MIKSELSLEVSDSLNPKVMRIYDTSHYCSDETIENHIIEILPVNKHKWLSFTVANKKFSLALNSSNLRYKRVQEASKLIALPDGIYEIKQSVKPNIHTVVHYYHLRIVDLIRKIKDNRSKLIDGKCDISKSEYVLNRDKLRDIQEYAEAAKWMVEECGDKIKGKELYEFSETLLEQYSNECKC